MYCLARKIYYFWLYPYVKYSTFFEPDRDHPIQSYQNWTRIGKNCQSMTNISELRRIGRPPNLYQFRANPWENYQFANINCQSPADSPQRNLTAHRQVWASDFWPQPSGNWVFPIRRIWKPIGRNPSPIRATPVPIWCQSITSLNLWTGPIVCQFDANQLPMPRQHNVNAWQKNDKFLFPIRSQSKIRIT